jgi:hypothetical protein
MPIITDSSQLRRFRRFTGRVPSIYKIRQTISFYRVIPGEADKNGVEISLKTK